jgi:hypothetical protein
MTVGPGRRLAAVVVPWAFLAAFAAVYALIILPRMRDGAVVAICVGAFIALVFLTFFVAAITFSRDVLTGRWPL